MEEASKEHSHWSCCWKLKRSCVRKIIDRKGGNYLYQFGSKLHSSNRKSTTESCHKVTLDTYSIFKHMEVSILGKPKGRGDNTFTTPYILFKQSAEGLWDTFTESPATSFYLKSEAFVLVIAVTFRFYIREVADSRTPGIFIRDTTYFHCYSMNCDS